MATEKHLSNPPIVEALVDIRVVPRPTLEVEALASAQQRLGLEYPVADRWNRLDAQFQLQPDQPLKSTTGGVTLHGFFFKSDDGKRIAQFRRDGFTYNWLRPYSSWETLMSKFWPAWNAFREISQPESVTRLGIRFINSLQVQPSLDVMLTTPPRFPQEFPPVTGFVSTSIVTDPSTELTGSVGVSVQKDPTAPGQVLIMTVDVFRSADDLVDESIRESLMQMRALKNRLFFACLTEAAVGRYL